MRMRFRCALSSSSKEEEEERSLFAQTVKRFGFWSVKDHGAPPDSVLFGEEELCAIVDEDDVVVDFVPRTKTVRERLRGRGSYVLVTSRRSECERKDYYYEKDDQKQLDEATMKAYLDFERRFVPKKKTFDREGFDYYDDDDDASLVLETEEARARLEERAREMEEEMKSATSLGNLALFSTRRSVRKDVWPGMYDVCTSGVQTARDFVKWENHGQTYFDPYAQCAIREIEEELGISGVKLSICARAPAEKSKRLQPIRKFAYSDKYMNIFGHCYKLELDAATEKKMAFLDGEVQEGSGEWLPLRLNDNEEELAKFMESVVPVGALCCASFLELMAKLNSGDCTDFTNADWIESWTSPKWEDRTVI